MQKQEKRVIELLYKNDIGTLDKDFKTDIIFYHDPNNYKEIWVKPNYNKQNKQEIFNYYWFHLYRYIGEFEPRHLLLIRGRMGNTVEKKIYLKEVY